MNRSSNSFLLFTFYFLLCFSACSIPNLEEPECTEARSAVKEFYSFHFGNDMNPSAENLKLREKFLSKNLFDALSTPEGLSAAKQAPYDYFTRTEDHPKAFRVGNCGVIPATGEVHLELVLFWKTDTREEERRIRVSAINENGKWVINEVNPNMHH